MHSRLAVGNVAGGLSQGLLGQQQYLVVCPALSTLKQPGHQGHIAGHDLTSIPFLWSP
jgi:hypothetical protein